MLTHDLSVGVPYRAKVCEVLLSIRDIPGHAGHVLGSRASTSQNGNHIFKGLSELAKKVLVLKDFVFVPANLAPAKDHGAGLSDDTVGVTLWTFPAFRQQGLVHSEFPVCNDG